MTSTSSLPPLPPKALAELAYWRQRYAAEGQRLSNSHYEPLFTRVYGLTGDDYAGKVILDIGCGPRGSLEWVAMAKQRVGLDPLVPLYRELGITEHRMEYVAAPSEAVPFPTGHFDITTCLNALDHVDDIEQTILEIKRVTRPGGLFLLSTEIDHEPTATEPIRITTDTLRLLEPEFETLWSCTLGTPPNHDLHGAVLAGYPPFTPGEPGIYVAKLRRR